MGVKILIEVIHICDQCTKMHTVRMYREPDEYRDINPFDTPEDWLWISKSNSFFCSKACLEAKLSETKNSVWIA